MERKERKTTLRIDRTNFAILMEIAKEKKLSATVLVNTAIKRYIAYERTKVDALSKIGENSIIVVLNHANKKKVTQGLEPTAKTLDVIESMIELIEEYNG